MSSHLKTRGTSPVVGWLVLPEQDHIPFPCPCRGFFYIVMNRLHKTLLIFGILALATYVFVVSPSIADRAETVVFEIKSAAPTTTEQIITPKHVVQEAVKTTTATTTSLYTVPVTKDDSVYEAMNLFASSSHEFTFKGKTYPELGFFVEEIGGIKNAHGFYWTLYVNNVYSNKGASTHPVHPGDKVEWRYEKL